MISFAVTAKLICVFVFAYAKCWFSHDAAHINITGNCNIHLYIIIKCLAIAQITIYHGNDLDPNRLFSYSFDLDPNWLFSYTSNEITSLVQLPF